MNICFLKGKIISKINFEFIVNSKNISIAIFEMELENKSKIVIKAYNEIADYCYSKLSEKDIIYVQGYLNKSMELIVEMIETVAF